MKVSEYIKKRGLRSILAEFDNNLKRVASFIKIECEVPKNKDISVIMRSFKEEIIKKNAEKENYYRYKKLFFEFIEKL